MGLALKENRIRRCMKFLVDKISLTREELITVISQGQKTLNLSYDFF